MRYLARKHDLYGSTPQEQALVDAAYDGTVDQRDKLLKVVWTKGDFVSKQRVLLVILSVPSVVHVYG